MNYQEKVEKEIAELNSFSKIYEAHFIMCSLSFERV